MPFFRRRLQHGRPDLGRRNCGPRSDAEGTGQFGVPDRDLAAVQPDGDLADHRPIGAAEHGMPVAEPQFGGRQLPDDTGGPVVRP